MPALNDRQREAATTLDVPILVLAGAGSGKTRVIAAKIAHLVDVVGMAPQHITAVTFTNKAAREMKARVGATVGSDRARGLSISTFHTLGLNMLRREHDASGLRRGFSIVDEADVEHLLRELSKTHHADRDALQQARWQISAWKNDLIEPDAAAAQAEDDRHSYYAALYGAYQRALKAYNAVDFDDLIRLPVTLLRERADTRERWQNRIRHLLVDEYQDTNGAQYELVRLLTGVRQALTVVGDDDQSIYAWRGARPENLARLRDDFPRLRVIKLEQNYRSTGRILHAANSLIDNNPHVFEKRLWSDMGPGEPIRAIVCRDEEDEAERIVSEIVHHRFRSGSPLGNYAILYRGNHQSRPFEKALRRQGLPYHLSGGTAFFARSEIRDLLAYLRLLVNPQDDTAFLRIINTPRRQIGTNTLEKLSAYAAQRQVPLLTAVEELGLAEVLDARALDRLRDFAAWLGRSTIDAARRSVVETVDQVIGDIGYREWLRQSSASEAAAERRWEAVMELREWIGRLENDEQLGDGLDALLGHLFLLDILERQDEEDPGERVALMTLHGAKGLEWPHVFLVGVEEGLLPHRSSIDDGNVEEERRLTYVGITRAQRTLVMSCAQRRRRGGQLERCERSRFFEELPAQDLQWEGRGVELSADEKRARGQASLAGLKALLEG